MKSNIKQTDNLADLTNFEIAIQTQISQFSSLQFLEDRVDAIANYQKILELMTTLEMLQKRLH
jgi:hypothetical protein